MKSKIIDALFEGLCLLQKSSLNRYVYYLSHMATTFTMLNIVVGPEGLWPEFMKPIVRALFLMTTPVEFLGNPSFVGFYIVGCLFVFSTAFVGIAVGRGRYIGEEGAGWKVKTLRTSLGILLSWVDPMLSLLLVPVACRALPESSSGVMASPSCFSSPWDLVAFVISLFLICVLFLCVLVGALMHVNDPVSPQILSRAHSRLDLLSVCFGFLLTTSFRLGGDYPVLLGIEFMLFHGTELTLLCVMQPYFRSFTNDLFTGFTSGVVWAGFCYFILACGGGVPSIAGVSPNIPNMDLVSTSYPAGIMLVVGIIPACIAGFHTSRRVREYLIIKLLTEFQGMGDDIPILADEDVFPVIAAKYDKFKSVPFWRSWLAAMVEVPLRFLQFDSSPRALAIAEYTLKKALLKNPQSAYLRLQYVTFLVSYRKNVALAAVRMEEFKAVDLDLDMQFSMLRKRWELERKLQLSSLGNAAMDMDTISFEELKQKIRDAKSLRLKAVQLIRKMWCTLHTAVRANEAAKARKQQVHGRRNRRNGGGSGAAAAANNLDFGGGSSSNKRMLQNGDNFGAPARPTRKTSFEVDRDVRKKKPAAAAASKLADTMIPEDGDDELGYVVTSVRNRAGVNRIDYPNPNNNNNKNSDFYNNNNNDDNTDDNEGVGHTIKFLQQQGQSFLKRSASFLARNKVSPSPEDDLEAGNGNAFMMNNLGAASGDDTLRRRGNAGGAGAVDGALLGITPGSDSSSFLNNGGGYVLAGGVPGLARSNSGFGAGLDKGANGNNNKGGVIAPVQAIEITNEDAAKVTAILGELHVIERRADEAYKFLRERARDSVEVLNDFALYLRHVKGNKALASELEEEADLLQQVNTVSLPKMRRSNSRPNSHSGSVQSSDDGGSSHGSGANGSFSHDEAVSRISNGIDAQIQQRRKLILVAVAVAIVGCVIASYVEFVVGVQVQETSFINLIESQYRQQSIFQMALGLRQAHATAITSTNISNANVILQRVRAAGETIWDAHERLVRTDTLLTSAAVDFAVTASSVNTIDRYMEGEFVTSSISADASFMKFIGRGLFVAATGADALVKFNPYAPQTLLELAFVMDNAMTVGKTMDDLSILVNRTASVGLSEAQVVMVLLLIIAIILEAVLILAVFRPGVALAFTMLNRATDRLKYIPKAAIAMQVSSLTRLSEQIARQDEDSKLHEAAAKSNLAASLAMTADVVAPSAMMSTAGGAGVASSNNNKVFSSFSSPLSTPRRLGLPSGSPPPTLPAPIATSSGIPDAGRRSSSEVSPRRIPSSSVMSGNGEMKVSVPAPLETFNINSNHNVVAPAVSSASAAGSTQQTVSNVYLVNIQNQAGSSGRVETPKLENVTAAVDPFAPHESKKSGDLQISDSSVDDLVSPSHALDKFVVSHTLVNSNEGGYSNTLVRVSAPSSSSLENDHDDEDRDSGSDRESGMSSSVDNQQQQQQQTRLIHSDEEEKKSGSEEDDDRTRSESFSSGDHSRSSSSRASGDDDDEQEDGSDQSARNPQRKPSSQLTVPINANNNTEQAGPSKLVINANLATSDNGSDGAALTKDNRKDSEETIVEEKAAEGHYEKVHEKPKQFGQPGPVQSRQSAAGPGFASPARSVSSQVRSGRGERLHFDQDEELGEMTPMSAGRAAAHNKTSFDRKPAASGASLQKQVLKHQYEQKAYGDAGGGVRYGDDTTHPHRYQAMPPPPLSALSGGNNNLRSAADANSRKLSLSANYNNTNNNINNNKSAAYDNEDNNLNVPTSALKSSLKNPMQNQFQDNTVDALVVPDGGGDGEGGDDDQGDDGSNQIRKSLDHNALRWQNLKLLFWGCLLGITIFWVVLLYVGISANKGLVSVAPTISAAGRMQSASTAAHWFATELVMCNTTKPNCGWFFTQEDLRCRLNSAALTLIEANQAAMYGGDYGFTELPVKRGISAVTASDKCSILSSDPDRFQEVLTGSGSADLSSSFNTLFFAPNCLTDLELSSRSSVRSRSKLALYTDPVSVACPTMGQGDARVQGGLHRLVEDFAQRLIILSQDTYAAGATMTYSLYKFVQQYEQLTNDLHYGITKSIMYNAEYALNLLDLYKTLMTVFFYVGLIAFIVQCTVLGYRLETVFVENVEITIVMSRLIKCAKMAYGADWEAILMPEDGANNNVKNIDGNMIGNNNNNDGLMMGKDVDDNVIPYNSPF